METKDRFYSQLHRDQQYGRSSFDVPRLVSIPEIRKWCNDRRGSAIQVADIGCGKGRFILDLVAILESKHQIQVSAVSGLDLVRTEQNVFDEIRVPFQFVQQNIDGENLPFQDQSFDFVSCNHVLEHIFETEKLMREFRRIIRPQGLCVVSVPNIAAWMNRIAFLFSGQPLGSEVGTERVDYGFWPGFMKKKLARFTPSGHIRDFTPRSLADLATYCGFRPVGWWAQNGGLVPTFGRNLGIVLKPAP